ncbi:MAG: glycoside hydrolase family 3 C-terminal domain-containing protein [Anaerolineae bacterium]|nr:glycoside hydrolase family 3 C-terminal domain-containing protein [Gemmatimonadaceae bacterium]
MTVQATGWCRAVRAGFGSLLIAALSGCASQSTSVEDSGSLEANWTRATLSRMSVREKAAQMVWPTIWGDYVSDDATQWVRVRQYITQEKVGGFTISIGSPVEIAVKLNAMQRMSDLPLLFGADLEFGTGYRAHGGYFFPGGYDLGGAVLFPPQMAVGASRDTALAYAQGRVTALEGRAIGLHVAYAPVLDVNNNPANPVINTRSYGEDPRLVAALGGAFIRGAQDNGMIATGKHFPGHGDTEINSHLALPVVDVSRQRLDSLELVPFRAAIKSGVGAVMSFHGSMPALDASGDPGTLSGRVLKGLLREELRFDGMIISDAMDMRGVLDRYGAREAAIRAVDAGADILIQPVDVALTIDAVVAGVTSGRYSEERLDRSVSRILAAKERLGLVRERFVAIDSVRAIVGDSTHVASARAVAERSITLVRDSLSLIPLKVPPNARVLSITFARRSDLTAGATFDAELRAVLKGVRSEYVNADSPTNLEAVLRAADSAQVTIVSSYVSHAWYATSVAAPRAFADLVTDLSARGRKPIVVAFGNPYLLQQIPSAPAYVVAWGGFPISQRATARALLGAAAITGRLPITIPSLAAFGAGIRRSAISAVR